MTDGVEFPELTGEEAAVLRELLRDGGVWNQRDISVALGVGYQTVRVWRSEATLPVDDAPPVVLPGEGGVSPRWYAATVRRWAFLTGRMDWDGSPLRKKPPGRPVRRWESVAREWVEVVPGSASREDGTVEVRYRYGKIRRVGAWILQRTEEA